MTTTGEWDALYENANPNPPAEVLQEYSHLLPSTGQALDLACGLAENSFLLANHGLDVEAWDNSDVAVANINQRANTQGLSVSATAIDVMNVEYPINRFDVIVFTHFLAQSLSSSIVAALKPGGLLFYQTFTQDKVTESGPKDRVYRLKRNELLSLFLGLQLVVYREEGSLGDVSQGFRNKAMLVGKKPGKNCSSAS